MTETLTNAEAQPADLGPLLEGWVENPPPSLSEALAEQGLGAEALEGYVRSGVSPEQAETLRKVLIQGATSGKPEDAALLAQLTPLLDPRERAWERVMRAKNSGEVLTATVTEATKGGVVVDLGVRGFVPSSQIGLSVQRNLTQFVGRTLKLRVLEVDRRRQTVILTNRQVMEEERAEKRRHAIGRLEEGEVRTGTVRRLTDIGAFVDVGGVDGLLHVSEISWERVEKPSDVLKVGEKIQVKIIRIDPGAGRVSLSMRRLATDPWEEARRKWMPGMTTKVTVSEIVPRGAVVKLDGGLEGFLPISELANRRVETPQEVVQVGQELDALITEFNPRDRRIVFSLKKLEQKKERQVIDTYQKKARGGSERTTLGDLFGHLFPEYQTPEPPAAEEKPARPETSPVAASETASGASARVEAEVIGADEEAAAGASAETTAAVGDETDAGAAEAVGAEEAAGETEAGATAAVGDEEAAGDEPEAAGEETAMVAEDEAGTTVAAVGDLEEADTQELGAQDVDASADAVPAADDEPAPADEQPEPETREA